MAKNKKKTLIITIVTLIISIAAYLAADRYLIEHVEIADVNAYSSTVSSVSSLQSGVFEIAQVDTNSDQENSTVNSITYDDWNYQSSNITISIKEYSSGSGEDSLAYFVADIVLSDATQLSNAFADNQFGRNIIAYTSQIAEENDAIFAINGDYYGFRTNGIIIRNSVIYRDEPARIGLAFYLDGTMKIYDETQTNAQDLLASGVWNTLSFGPALIEDNVIVDNLATIEIDTNFGNHPIQGNQPRTGVGTIDENHFVFIVVDGRSTGYSKGATLTDFAEMFQALGCSDAYNLDGGGSSTMYFMGRVVNNPLGKNKERGTSDILYIGEE
ncbi:MAG: phosphodiester glycosidase family protein [Anaerolineaceae bacterium]